MNKKDKDEVYKIVADAVHEVVVPEFEKIHERLTGVEDRLADVENSVDNLGRKFDAQQDRLDRHGKQIEDNKERILGLESASLVVNRSLRDKQLLL